uniref:Protein SCAI n=1 Tax=Ciona intestinalis TaxID=7719 RepID=F6YDK0_CIOIN
MQEGQTTLVDNRKVVQEFCELLECSKQLFNGLRDLPQYGQRQWQPYFARTFETYTKLWKFQQENRLILDRDYNLKRWQIGEIASKIGQLYYHYYLRTSETNYLNEAYQFYSAIRSRNYYKNVSKEDSSDLLLKKHRYYARFIVVCLLLNYKQDVHDLVSDFSKQVQENKRILKETEETEWDQVVLEIKEFLDVSVLNKFIHQTMSEPVQILNADTFQRCDVTLRMSSSSLPALEKGKTKRIQSKILLSSFPGVQTRVSLGDAIIVGNSPSQMKFSELTVDMFRMVQVLERSPCVTADPVQRSQRANPSQNKIKKYYQESADRLMKRDNPHKYLLYRPTFFQLYTFLATAVKELPPANALLLYLSAHGSNRNHNNNSECTEDGGYELGGVITNDRKEDDTSVRKQSTLKNMHCIHPADLYPFTRKPMLIIVDSDNANAFSNLPNLFGQPVVCLMAPDQLPHSTKEHFSRGRLLTSFLYSPLMAFMLTCGIDQTSDRLYETCSQVVEKALQEAQRSYLRSRTIGLSFSVFFICSDHSFLQFFGDEFIRLILLRFAFCYCTLRLHRAYKDSRFYPKSHPALPEEDFVGNPAMNKAIIDMADVLGVRGLFLDCNPA